MDNINKSFKRATIWLISISLLLSIFNIMFFFLLANNMASNYKQNELKYDIINLEDKLTKQNEIIYKELQKKRNKIFE